MVQAINQALDQALAQDERVLVFGEDVGAMGGVSHVGLARIGVILPAPADRTALGIRARNVVA